MPAVTDFWLFLLTGLVLNITPGPDTAYVIGRSAQGGFKAGALAAIGIGAGCFVHITAAAIGLSALIATSAAAFTLLKFIGAAYLVYVGARMLLKKPATKSQPSSPGSGSMTNLSQVFWQGFWTNVLNPKVAIFFLAFLPQFIPSASADQAASFVVLGLVFNATGTAWNIAVAGAAAGAARAIGGTGSIQVWVERLLGSLFIGLGLKLAWSER